VLTTLPEQPEEIVLDSPAALLAYADMLLELAFHL